MRRIIVYLLALLVVWLVFEDTSTAEHWIALQKHAPIAYYDRDSIQYPFTSMYDFGLFTMGKTNKDIMRVWTKLDLKDSETPHILYEIKFSTRVCKAIYAVDQFGNMTPPYDTAYRPIPPGSFENDLFETVQDEVKPESILKKLGSLRLTPEGSQ